MSMGVILKPDESGNWGKIGSDPAGSMSELLTFQSGAVAIGNGTVQDVSGYDILTLNVTISGTATVFYEASIDGTSWITTPFYLMNGAANNSSISSISGIRFSITGFKFFRVRVSSWTSGTVDVSGYATIGNLTQVIAAGQFGNVDNNAPTTNNLMGVGAFNLLYDGTNWTRQRTVQAVGDGSNGNGLTATGLNAFNGTSWDRVKSVNTGQLRTTTYSSAGLEVGIFNVAVGIPDGSALGVGGLVTANVNFGFNGSTFDRQRVGKIYKYIEYLNLPTSTSTTIWTPASGKKFRLMMVSVTTSATVHLHLRDATTIFHTTRTSGDSQIFDFGNGYLSAAANNVLEIRNDSGTTTNVWVTAWGTEE